MLRRILITSLAVIFVGMFGACFLNPEEVTVDDPGPSGPTQKYEPLTERNSVLNNLELAYKERNINEYDRVLDENFTFFFADGDVSNGNTPEQWSREAEVGATRNMFDENFPGTNPIVRIELDLQFKNAVWVEITPDEAPTETWFTATVPYTFTIDALPDQTWITQGVPTAQYTVRPQGTTPETYKLVQWRDLAQLN